VAFCIFFIAKNLRCKNSIDRIFIQVCMYKSDFSFLSSVFKFLRARVFCISFQLMNKVQFEFSRNDGVHDDDFLLVDVQWSRCSPNEANHSDRADGADLPRVLPRTNERIAI
jgi:hypothetical protein